MSRISLYISFKLLHEIVLGLMDKSLEIVYKKTSKQAYISQLVEDVLHLYHIQVCGPFQFCIIISQQNFLEYSM